MTRRRALALVFGALALVFIIGSIATVTDTRSQLIEDIDDDLANELDLNLQFYGSFSLDNLDEIVIAEHRLATIVIDSLGRVEVALPAGSVVDPLPPPDLPASRIISRLGEDFTVDGTDGGPSYRVTVGRLDDGRYLALAAPLDAVHDTLAGLARRMFITLFSMMAVLSLIFWIMLRASLRPYDELVDTAEAIARGDMNRRAVDTTHDPEITRLTDALNTMLDRIQLSLDEREAAEQRVKRFAADASHELRTPISTIAGYSELYLSGAAIDAASVDKQMARINGEANRMGRLVNNLLTLARFDQGAPPDVAPVDVGALLADVVTDAMATEPMSPVRLHTSAPAPDRDGPAVMADRDALQQVFTNLISNARAHAPGASVDVTVAVDAEHVMVSVVDDGPGMAPEVADQIFERFYRADESRSPKLRSAGLGLSIVLAIVESHGGSIDVETRPGSGATFTVTLPRITDASRP